MPFTLAHPAFALPLRRWLPLTPLVIGSMVPDVALSFPALSYGFTHSLLGLVTVDLAMGAAGVLLWRNVLRDPLEQVAPRWLRERVPPAQDTAMSGPAVAASVAAGVIAGAATHVGVDLFTHGYGLAQQFPFLAATVAGHPVHEWLQHGLGILGVLAMGILVLRQPRRWTEPPAARRWTLLGPPLALWIIAGVGILASTASRTGSLRVGLFDAWTISLPMFVLALVSSCLVYRARGPATLR